MPIYEYQCDGCKEVFEVFQKLSDPAPTQHTCGSTQVHRVLSNTSFVLKGTGWYITDYGRKDHGSEGGGKSKKDGEGGSDSKSEASHDKGSSSQDGGSEGSKNSSADKAASSRPQDSKSPSGGGSKGGGGGAAAA